MKSILAIFLIPFSICIFHPTVRAQNPASEVAGIPVNYDELKIPSYSLPDPLKLASGKKVTSAKIWYQKRRPEILDLFKKEQFGKIPNRDEISFRVFESGSPAFDHQVIRKQVRIYFTKDTTLLKADLLVYLPARSEGPVPLLLKIGFSANSNSVDDQEVKGGTIWTREGKKIPASEGRKFGSFDVKKFTSEGIGVAFIYYGDIEPDFADGIKYGIRGHYLKPGETWPAPDEWGTISAWAWGLSCVMDYLESDDQIDAKSVALYGVSRLGKTVLWTGALDTRFAMVMASCSGEGGAAISRRQYGETIKHMIDPTRYHYQFCDNRSKYSSDPGTCPVDAHMLISLIAPRPLLLQTGDTDYWSDPKGEFEAAVAAEAVYQLLGKKGLETEAWPPAGTAILNDLGYYMHAGGHGSLPDDFNVLIDFMKKHFF
ncbi:MAG: hypothetical protein KDC80_09190 [Saprospiraceae bacterium]|nr:hypothetical protein [Saprospiraceae bacterium]